MVLVSCVVLATRLPRCLCIGQGSQLEDVNRRRKFLVRDTLSVKETQAIVQGIFSVEMKPSSCGRLVLRSNKATTWFIAQSKSFGNLPSASDSPVCWQLAENCKSTNLPRDPTITNRANAPRRPAHAKEKEIVQQITVQPGHVHQHTQNTSGLPNNQHT